MVTRYIADVPDFESEFTNIVYISKDDSQLLDFKYIKIGKYIFNIATHSEIKSADHICFAKLQQEIIRHHTFDKIEFTPIMLLDNFPNVRKIKFAVSNKYNNSPEFIEKIKSTFVGQVFMLGQKTMFMYNDAMYILTIAEIDAYNHYKINGGLINENTIIEL
jgi:hypothetical protein